MLKKFLIWLASFRRGYVMIWIRPVAELCDSGGEVVFFNTLLRCLKAERFRGLSELHKLSIRLNRPIAFYKKGGVAGNCDSCLDCISEMMPKHKKEDLEKLAKEIDEKSNSLLIMSGNPNLPFDKVPRIYV